MSVSKGQSCFLCGSNDDQYKYFVGNKGSKAFKLVGDLPSRVFDGVLTGGEFLCRACYKLLDKRDRIAQNLKLCEDKVRSLGSNLRGIRTDANTAGVNVRGLEESEEERPKILVKRDRAAKTLRTCESTIKAVHSASSIQRVSTQSTSTGSEFTPVSTSTPVKPNRPVEIPSTSRQTTTCTSFPSLSQDGGEQVEKLTQRFSDDKTGVEITATWPSQRKHRKLKPELESLGKAMVRGTWGEMARAVYKVPQLRTELIKCVLKQLSAECGTLVKHRQEIPSLLTKTTADDIQNLSFGKITDEWRKRAPLLHSTMTAIACPPRRRRRDSGTGSQAGNVDIQQDLEVPPSVAVAGAILLKQRSRMVNSVQLMLTLLLKYTGFQAMTSYLSSLCIGVSARYFTRKADEFGSTFNQDLLCEKANDTKVLESINSQASGTSDTAVHQPVISDGSATHSLDLDDGNCQDTSHNTVPELSNGSQYVIDNYDIFQKVRNMTEDNQNKDFHWVNHNRIPNRVSANHLQDDGPKCDVFDLENSKITPSLKEHLTQRYNYITLVERILVENIPYFKFCSDVVTWHIPHPYRKEMAEKSKKECLGIIFEDENTSEGINKVLHVLHDYIPKAQDTEETSKYQQTGIVGDQLTVERTANCLLSLANGFTTDERLEGLYVGIADWHSDMKFLDLIFTRLYNTKSAEDKCTLYADRNLINRRNVSTDTHHAYAPNKQMFLLAVKARVIAAALSVLGMKDLDMQPTQRKFPSSASRRDKGSKRTYLRLIASYIVDNYVVDQRACQKILDDMFDREEQQEALANQMVGPDGRYVCRHPGCGKSFKHAGKHRRNHELNTHGLDADADLPAASATSKTSNVAPKESSDDMFNYQCNVLDHGLLYMNFIDAVAEGDGDRIMVCWKFLLLHFYADGTKSYKYALEALYIQFQQQALLSPKQAFIQKWNRSVNHGGHGRNVALDLDLEHDNNHLKEATRKMGPRLSKPAVTRVCKSLKLAREVLGNVNKECRVMRRSGKHFVASTKADLDKLVSNLVREQALTIMERRAYNCFMNCPRTALQDVDMAKLCKWIEKHKYEMTIGRKAR